ncbi:MAG: hypothetical protein WD431_24520, partial [Cyclobacteriaceae bacterium]
MFTYNFKFFFLISGMIALFACQNRAWPQGDSSLVSPAAGDTSKLTLNMDAVYNRPFLEADKMPIAIGGYVEA